MILPLLWQFYFDSGSAPIPVVIPAAVRLLQVPITTRTILTIRAVPSS